MNSESEQVTRFFELISLWEHLYERKTICFLGVKSGSNYTIVQAKVIAARGWTPSPSSLGIYRTDKIIVGQLDLSDLRLSLRQLVEEINDGRFPLPGEILNFPCEEQGRVSTFFLEHQLDAAISGKRLSTLMLGGKQQHNLVKKIELDWHLKGQPIPYESLDELARAYGVGDINLGFANIELVAAHLCEVDFSAHVEETTAFPGIILPNDIDKAKFSIGYCVLSAGVFVARSLFTGDQLTWTKGEWYWVGSKKIDIPAGAAVQCFASYEGVAQFQGWIGDPKIAPNLKRVVYDEIDSDLEVLKDFLFEEKKPRKESRDFEQGVVWLFWLLGFTILHPGHKRLEDNADLIAATPKGNLLVIECTTGLLSKEGKLQSLLQRVASLRKRLSRAGFNAIEVLPVGVLSKPRDEIAGDIAEASKLGVLVLSTEDLRNGLIQSFVPGDADRYFSHAVADLKRLSGEPSGFGSAPIQY